MSDDDPNLLEISAPKYDREKKPSSSNIKFNLKTETSRWLFK